MARAVRPPNRRIRLSAWRKLAVLSRTRREEMVFARPFVLKGWAKPHPAGSYDVETEEELVEGISFPVWRRVATTITRTARDGGIVQAIAVDPQELAEAKAADLA